MEEMGEEGWGRGGGDLQACYPSSPKEATSHKDDVPWEPMMQGPGANEAAEEAPEAAERKGGRDAGAFRELRGDPGQRGAGDPHAEADADEEPHIHQAPPHPLRTRRAIVMVQRIKGAPNGMRGACGRHATAVRGALRALIGRKSRHGKTVRYVRVLSGSYGLQ